MAKPRLVLQPNQFSSFRSYYLEDFWSKYFELESYDPDKLYDTNDCAFVFWWMNSDDELTKQLADLGYKILIDNLWEFPTGRKDFHWIEHDNWFWYNESLWWQSLGYDQYRPVKGQDLKLGLMPMRRQTSTRDYILSRMSAWLDQMIWSYGDRKLPDDGDQNCGDYQRYFNPRWYDQSYCSIVVETFLDQQRIWTTEKTMKAMAFFHPFLMFAAPGTLERTRRQGFETFGELFDESYDCETEFVKRCDIIVDNVASIEIDAYDPVIQKKLIHNHEHFFNFSKIKHDMLHEIVHPILDYVNAR